MENLYFSGSKSLFFLDTEIKCDVCNNKIPFGSYIIIINANKFGIKHYCTDCFVYAVLPFSKMQVLALITPIENMPDDRKLTNMRMPNLKDSNGNLSVFDIEKLPSEITKDNTIYSNRHESLEGVKIGKDLNLEYEKAKEKELSMKELDDFFKDSKQAQIMKPDEVKKIGNRETTI